MASFLTLIQFVVNDSILVPITLVVFLNTDERHVKSVTKLSQEKEPDIKVFNNRDTLDEVLLNKDSDVIVCGTYPIKGDGSLKSTIS